MVGPARPCVFVVADKSSAIDVLIIVFGRVFFVVIAIVAVVIVLETVILFVVILFKGFQ